LNIVFIKLQIISSLKHIRIYLVKPASWFNIVFSIYQMSSRREKTMENQNANERERTVREKV